MVANPHDKTLDPGPDQDDDGMRWILWMPDDDNDGIPDVVDYDDDNDGVLDVNDPDWCNQGFLCGDPLNDQVLNDWYGIIDSLNEDILALKNSETLLLDGGDGSLS